MDEKQHDHLKKEGYQKSLMVRHILKICGGQVQEHWKIAQIFSAKEIYPLLEKKKLF